MYMTSQVLVRLVLQNEWESFSMECLRSLSSLYLSQNKNKGGGCLNDGKDMLCIGILAWGMLLMQQNGPESSWLAAT